MSQPSPSNSLDPLRTKAHELHVAGRLMEAIQLQVQMVNTGVKTGQVQTEDYHRLGVMLFAAKDFRAAATAFEMTKKREPDFPDVSANLGLCLILTERLKEAIPYLLEALKERPDSLDVIDGLAHAYGKLGELENSRAYGEKSLLVKDGRAQKPPPGFQLGGTAGLPSSAPPLRLDRPQENIIAYSLFGNQDRYTRGAVK